MVDFQRRKYNTGGKKGEGEEEGKERPKKKSFPD